MYQDYRPSVDIKLLAKWIGVLFWLTIVSIVAGLFTGNNSDELYGIGWLIRAGADLAYGIVLFVWLPRMNPTGCQEYVLSSVQLLVLFQLR